MTRVPHLVQVRQVGPKDGRDIWGVCSICGNHLLAQLTDSESPSSPLLAKRLEEVFKCHFFVFHAANVALEDALALFHHRSSSENETFSNIRSA